MKRYQLIDLRVGTQEVFEVEITLEMLDQFAELSGDVNPLHMDEVYAKKRGFKGRVAFGLLTSSLYSRLAGVYLPGENCLLQGIDVKFLKPVFAGDQLAVSGKVSYINEAYGQIEIKAQIVNQEGVKISTAKIKAGVYDG